MNPCPVCGCSFAQQKAVDINTENIREAERRRIWKELEGLVHGEWIEDHQEVIKSIVMNETPRKAPWNG